MLWTPRNSRRRNRCGEGCGGAQMGQFLRLGAIPKAGCFPGRFPRQIPKPGVIHGAIPGSIPEANPYSRPHSRVPPLTPLRRAAVGAGVARARARGGAGPGSNTERGKRGRESARCYSSCCYSPRAPVSVRLWVPGGGDTPWGGGSWRGVRGPVAGAVAGAGVGPKGSGACSSSPPRLRGEVAPRVVLSILCVINSSLLPGPSPAPFPALPLGRAVVSSLVSCSVSPPRPCWGFFSPVPSPRALLLLPRGHRAALLSLPPSLPPSFPPGPLQALYKPTQTSLCLWRTAASPPKSCQTPAASAGQGRGRKLIL